MSYIQKPKDREKVTVSESRRFWVVLVVPLLLAAQVMAANSSEEQNTKTDTDGTTWNLTEKVTRKWLPIQITGSGFLKRLTTFGREDFRKMSWLR